MQEKHSSPQAEKYKVYVLIYGLQLYSPWEHSFDGNLELHPSGVCSNSPLVKENNNHCMEWCLVVKISFFLFFFYPLTPSIYRVQLPCHSHALFFHVMKHIDTTYAELLEDAGDGSVQPSFAFLHEQKRTIATTCNFC